jgi:ABC-type transport system involved in cytochrome c biogenesis permease component
MHAWPVIVRELRAEARRPLNTGLRVLAASGIVLLFWIVVAASPGEAGKLGMRLFLALHWALLAAILVLTPLLAGDCLSRERREGTLDLLFLTPLRPVGVIVAKCLVHGLRVGSFMLAALPVMALAFLLGGVTWLDFFSAVTFEICVLLLALGGSILASSFCQRAGFTTALALLFGGALAFKFTFACLLLTSGLSLAADASPNVDVLYGMMYLPTGTLEMNGWSKLVPQLPSPLNSSWYWFLTGALAFSALCFCAIVAFSAHVLRHGLSGQDHIQAPPRLMEWLWRTWPAHPFANRLRRWKLDYNPMIWFFTAARGNSRFRGRWLYLLAPLVTGLVATGVPPNHWIFYAWLSAFVLAALSVQAASSFRSERTDGSIEVLLSTPQTTHALVWGRVFGLYYRYLPTLLLLSFFFWLNREADSGGRHVLDGWVWNRFFLMTIWGVFLVQPVIGVNSALRLRYAPVAVVYTVFFAVANVLCYLTLFMMAFMFRRALTASDHHRLNLAGKLAAAFPEMGLLDLAVIAILQALLAWRYITLMNRRLSRSLLAGEIR